MGCMERGRQWAGDECRQVVNGVEPVLRSDFDELLIFDLKISVATPAAAAVAGVTPFLDFHERHLNRQSRVRENPREMNQLVEHVEQLPALWAEPSSGDSA